MSLLRWLAEAVRSGVARCLVRGFDVLAGVGRPEFALSWSVFALLVVLAGCGGRVGLVERVRNSSLPRVRDGLGSAVQYSDLRPMAFEEACRCPPQVPRALGKRRSISGVCPKALEEACRYPPQAPNAWGSASQYSDLRPMAFEEAPHAWGSVAPSCSRPPQSNIGPWAPPKVDIDTPP